MQDEPVVRRASRGGSISSFVRPEKRLAIYLRDRFRCVYCDADLADAWATKGSASGNMITLDHLVPRVSGGTNEASNLVTACLRCNCRRGDMPWREFVAILSHEILRGVGKNYLYEMTVNRVRNATRRKLNVTLAKALIRDRQRADVKAAEEAR